MNDDQITALAREYGEYVANSLDFDMCSDPELRHKLVVKGHSESAQLVLEFLLRRFCLVEKSKIREAYKDAQKDQHNSEGDFALTLAGRNRSAVLIDLFPEIAKEVENDA